MNRLIEECGRRNVITGIDRNENVFIETVHFDIAR